MSEIAQPHHRGWLSAVTVPTMALGTLLSYALGAVTSWHWVAVIAVIAPVVIIPGITVLSDSPYWYVQQGEERKALLVSTTILEAISSYSQFFV